MTPKRAPAPPGGDWDPTATQILYEGLNRKPELQWRQDVADQLAPLAKTLGEVRDLAMKNQFDLTTKAATDDVNKRMLQALSDIEVLKNNIRWLRYLTISVGVAGLAAKFWK